MSNTSLKRIREFIGVYHMTDVLSVSTPPHTSPAYEVSHKTGADDCNIYLCKTLIAAAECVNDIIFDLPMGDRVEEI
jgi:hypothetical protein